MGQRPILQAKGLCVRFNSHFALQELDLDVYQGEVFGITGPNGSGKTTLINLISGAVRPDTGLIRFRGEEITHLKPYQRVRRGIARTFQQSRAFHQMTVYENVLLAALNGRRSVGEGDTPQDLAGWVENVLRRTTLFKQRYWTAGNLSSGCLRRLEVARALATAPDLMLLDEPFAALSAREEKDMLELMRGLKKARITLMMVSHRLDYLAEVADALVVLREGRKLRQGPAREILEYLVGRSRV